MGKTHIQIKSRIELPKSDNPETLSVIVTKQDICCLAQFMKWAVMQEILKLLHRIAQFMKWALRVSCYCPFHELGNSAAQFMNWTISQIGRNIYKRKELDRYMAEWFRQWICVCNDFVASSSPGNTIIVYPCWSGAPVSSENASGYNVHIYVKSTTVGKGTY